jgi:hypothetical protein
VSCLSHLIISYYEGSGAIKKNSKIELFFYPIFFISLYIAVVNKNLFIVAIVVLIKEIALFIFRSIRLSKEIIIIKHSYLVILILIFFLLYSVNANF